MICGTSPRWIMFCLSLVLALSGLAAQVTSPTAIPTATPLPGTTATSIPGATATPLPGSSASPAAGATPTPVPIELQPIPYKSEEFPVWAYDIRRGEIITVGSFPIAYLVSSLCFDIGRYLVKLGNSDPTASQYTPFSASKPQNTSVEYAGVIVAAIGVSIAVALIDFIIGQSQAAEKDRQERQRKADAAKVKSIIREPVIPTVDPATDPPADSGALGRIIDPRQESIP